MSEEESSSSFSVIFLAILAGAFALILVYGDQGIMHLRGLNQEKTRIELENERIKEKNRRILSQIERVKNDPLYIEDEARNKLGLIRPSETIYRLSDEPDHRPAR